MYSNEAERASQHIFDDFKLKITISSSFSYKHNVSALMVYCILTSDNNESSTVQMQTAVTAYCSYFFLPLSDTLV